MTLYEIHCICLMSTALCTAPFLSFFRENIRILLILSASGLGSHSVVLRNGLSIPEWERQIHRVSCSSSVTIQLSCSCRPFPRYPYTMYLFYSQ